MTNQWTEEYGVDGGPEYDHCIACGRPHLLFHGADYCTQCRGIRQEYAKRVKDRGECRGGCGCTVLWSVLRCGACRAAGRWQAPTSDGVVFESSVVDWEQVGRYQGNNKTKAQAEAARYLETIRNHDGNA